jgi:hypothetical protein
VESFDKLNPLYSIPWNLIARPQVPNRHPVAVDVHPLTKRTSKPNEAEDRDPSKHERPPRWPCDQDPRCRPPSHQQHERGVTPPPTLIAIHTIAVAVCLTIHDSPGYTAAPTPRCRSGALREVRVVAPYLVIGVPLPYRLESARVELLHYGRAEGVREDR